MRQRLDGGSGDPRGEADALIDPRGFLTSRGATAEALAALDRAEPLVEKAGDLRLQGAMFNQRAVIYGQTGRPREAMRGLRARAGPAPPDRRSPRHRPDLEQSRRLDSRQR